jgi:NADH-quinone oxidoreductase subunit E
MKSIEDILKEYPHAERDVLIPMLQSVQDEFGFLSDEAIERIGEHLKLPASKVYGLATFYNQFTFKSRGKYHIQVCDGSTCHLDHSALLLKELYKQLGIRDGETTRDGMFSLEVQACIGACGQSPVLSINGRYYTRVKPQQISMILEESKSESL